MSRKAIWRRPSETVCRKLVHVVASGEPGQAGKEDRRDGDREHSLREHVDPKRRVDRGRRDLRIDEAAREEASIDAVEVDEAEPERTGSISTKTRRTAGSRQSMTARRRSSSPAQPRQRQQELDHGPDQDRAGVDVQLRVLGARARDADQEADDDREVPEDRRQRRHGEVLVAVQDPDDDPRDPEQDDDREEDLREADGEVFLVGREPEQGDDQRGRGG